MYVGVAEAISLERRRPMDEVVYASERSGMGAWLWAVLYGEEKGLVAGCCGYWLARVGTGTV